MSLPCSSRYWTRSVATADLDVVHDVAGGARTGAGWVFRPCWINDEATGRFFYKTVGLIVWRHNSFAFPRFVNLNWVAVEARICKASGRPLEIHDGEEKFVVVLVDARAAADDLLELSG